MKILLLELQIIYLNLIVIFTQYHKTEQAKFFLSAVTHECCSNINIQCSATLPTFYGGHLCRGHSILKGTI